MFVLSTNPKLERRATPRHPTKQALLCGVSGEARGQRWTALVHDISATGIGLLLREPVAQGTVLNLRFWGPARNAVRRRHACVMHATPQAAGLFVVGCALDAWLSLDELKALQ
jgi:hypothetical protein